MRARARSAVAFAGLLLTACIGCSSPTKPASKPCAGHLVRAALPLPVEEARELPEVGPHRQIEHRFREPGFMALDGVEEGIEQIGDYRVAWWVDSDRGRPGDAGAVISLPDLCRGGELSYRFTGTPGWRGRLHRDPKGGVDVLVVDGWPQSTAIAFRLVPGPAPSSGGVIHEGRYDELAKDALAVLDAPGAQAETARCSHARRSATLATWQR